MGGYITFLFFLKSFFGSFVLSCFFVFFEHGSARWNFSRIGNTGYNISPPFSRLISKKWRQAAEDKQRSIGSGKIKSERNRRKMKYSFGFSFHLWQNKKKKRIIIIKTKQIKTVKLKQHLDSRYHQIVWWGIGWERSPTGQSQSFLWKTKRNGHKPNKSWW